MQDFAAKAQKEKELDLFSDNPFLVAAEEDEEYDLPESIPLWDTFLPAFKVFKTASLFLIAEGVMDSGILLRLIDEKGLPLEDTLMQVYSLWVGYARHRGASQSTETNTNIY